MHTPQSNALKVLKLQEFYYAADSAGTYHSCRNCPVGKEIEPRFLRKTYFPDYYKRKCEVCKSLEDDGSGVLGVADPINED